MKSSDKPFISVVVPVYNEVAGLLQFHESLTKVLHESVADYEVIYVNDGSTDGSEEVVENLHKENKRVRLVSLTRNFGKEIATTAGLHAAKGDAILTLDADGQYPVELIPAFIEAWRAGNKVVIGRRTNREASALKRLGSKMFYWSINRFSRLKLEPGASDFRLIDSSVQAEFNRMTERNRLTRGLIDWLGYRKVYIPYKEKLRQHGQAAQSYRKLVKLWLDSMVSLSLSPLYLVAYIGVIVLPLSFFAGIVMLINFLTGDPLSLHATASAYIIVFMLFLIGVLLVSQGIIGLYLSHIHTESQNRPLYVVDKERSV